MIECSSRKFNFLKSIHSTNWPMRILNYLKMTRPKIRWNQSIYLFGEAIIWCLFRPESHHWNETVRIFKLLTIAQRRKSTRFNRYENIADSKIIKSYLDDVPVDDSREEILHRMRNEDAWEIKDQSSRYFRLHHLQVARHWIDRETAITAPLAE